jgi:hypothetical protein
MAVCLILITIIWLVMQGGNKAFGKTIGTLMGIGVLAIPVIAFICIAAAVIIPFLVVCLPVIAVLAFGVYVLGANLFCGKPKKVVP